MFGIEAVGLNEPTEPVVIESNCLVHRQQVAALYHFKILIVLYIILKHHHISLLSFLIFACINTHFMIRQKATYFAKLFNNLKIHLVIWEVIEERLTYSNPFPYLILLRLTFLDI